MDQPWRRQEREVRLVETRGSKEKRDANEGRERILNPDDNDERSESEEDEEAEEAIGTAEPEAPGPADESGLLTYELRDESRPEPPVRIPIKCEDIEFDGLADGGAAFNIIDKSFYKAHKKTMGPIESVSFGVKVASGQRVALGGTLLIDLTIPHPSGDVKGRSRFYVMEADGSWEVLLGKPWLKQVNATVDYGRDTLTISQGGQSRLWESIRKDGSYLCGLIGEGEADRLGFTSATTDDLDNDLSGTDRAETILSKVTIGPDLTPQEQKEVQALVREFHDVWATDLKDIGECPHTVHRLKVPTDAKLPRYAHGRPLTEPQLIAAKKTTAKLLAAGIIEQIPPENVAGCYPTVMAAKKGKSEEGSTEKIRVLADEALALAGLPSLWRTEIGTPPCTGLELPVPTTKGGLASHTPPVRTNVPNSSERTDAAEEPTSSNSQPTYRMCHNFGALNKITGVPPFMPGDLESKVLRHSGKRWICQMDGLGAFFWVTIHPDDRRYLCFGLPNLGYFSYRRLPMGPTGSPATYQVAVLKTLGDLVDPGPVSVWMDDIFTSGNDFTTIKMNLREILLRARRDGLRLSAEKTFLFVTTAHIGGSLVSTNGVSPDLNKIEAILKWPKPTTAKDVASFVATCNCFRAYFPGFADIARPLYALASVTNPDETSRKGKKRLLEETNIEELWTADCDKAMTLLKAGLTRYPILVPGRYDGTKFGLTTDASKTGLGAHLWQADARDGGRRSIAYASRGTTAPEAKLHSSALELLAVKWALDKFDKWIYGQKVLLETDCQAVRDLMKNEAMPGTRSVWKEAIATSGIVRMVHRPGRINTIADALSRNGSDPGRETTAGWEQRLGVSNSLYESTAAVNLVETDEENKIIQAFEGDELLDVVRWLTLTNVDSIHKDSINDVKRKALSYWTDGQLLKRRIPGVGAVRILPQKDGRDEARRAHEDGGHIGRDLTLGRLVSKTHWAGMRKDIDDVIARCRRCCQFGPRLQRYLLKPVFAFGPFDVVAMDYLAMPHAGGYESILVAIDVYTRYIMAWPCKSSGSAALTVKAVREMSERFVRPKVLWTDNGTPFNNKDVREWCDSDTELKLCTPYEHVGIVENANHLILERLRRMCNLGIHHMPTLTNPPVPKSWPKTLPESLAKLNERKVPYLGGRSPKEILFGTADAANIYSLDFDRRLLLLASLRLDSETAFTNEQAQRRNTSDKRRYAEYKPAVGDLVLAYDASEDRSFAVGAKLKAKWQGPLRVKECGDRSVSLETLEGVPKRGRVGWSKLKRWMEDDVGEGGGKEADGCEGRRIEEDGDAGRAKERTNEGSSGEKENDNTDNNNDTDHDTEGEADNSPAGDDSDIND